MSDNDSDTIVEDSEHLHREILKLLDEREEDEDGARGKSDPWKGTITKTLDQCIEGSGQRGVCVPTIPDEGNEPLDLNQYLEFLGGLSGYNTLIDTESEDKLIDILDNTEITEKEWEELNSTFDLRVLPPLLQ